jgi:small nuclear ribonucleoprotein F
MTDINALNPIPFLTELLKRKVVIRLKWGIEYHGIMASFDKYMNVQLLDAEEYFDGQCKGALGEILIRCNNVLYIRELAEEENA